MLRDIQIKTTSGSKIYFATKLHGGGAGALDDIDGATLYDGDVALVVDLQRGMFWYRYDQDNAGVDNSHTIIAPDTGAVNGRWVLVIWLGCASHMSFDADFPRRVIGDVS